MSTSKYLKRSLKSTGKLYVQIKNGVIATSKQHGIENYVKDSVNNRMDRKDRRHI